MSRIRRRALCVAALAVSVLALSGVAPVPPPSAGSGKTVARIWRGRTLAAKADEYEAYLFASGITRVRATPGNLGVTVLRRADGDQTEFLVISIWESLDAVKRFAGADYEKAVILDRDREYLVEVEPTVRHYTVEKEERTR
jgi:heme-degrading monooxygenase HmoA